MVPSTLAIVVGSMVAPALARTIRPGLLIAAGLAITAVGYLLIVFVEPGAGVALLVTGFVLAFFGGGPMGAMGNNLVLSAAPPENAGSAASMSESGNQLGIALGIAVMGSLGTSVYRAKLAATAPVGTPDAAFDGIAEARTAAAGLPGQQGADLLAAAREAFTAGLNTVALVGCVLFVVLTVVAATMLRDVLPLEGAPEADHEPRPANAGG